MKLSTLPSAVLVSWAGVRIPELHGRGFPEATTAMGVENGKGDLVGVVCFHTWDPEAGTIEVSAVSEDPRWLLAREAIARMWDYAFITCDCQKIWSRTPRSNVRALRFLKALGFKYEAILPRQFGLHEDAVISARYREDYYSSVAPNLARPDFRNGLRADAKLAGESAASFSSGQPSANAPGR